MTQCNHQCINIRKGPRDQSNLSLFIFCCTIPAVNSFPSLDLKNDITNSHLLQKNDVSFIKVSLFIAIHELNWAGNIFILGIPSVRIFSVIKL